MYLFLLNNSVFTLNKRMKFYNLAKMQKKQIVIFFLF